MILAQHATRRSCGRDSFSFVYAGVDERMVAHVEQDSMISRVLKISLLEV